MITAIDPHQSFSRARRSSRSAGSTQGNPNPRHHASSLASPALSLFHRLRGDGRHHMPLKNPSPLDPLSPAERSERMGRVRGKDTKPELIVRRLVHGLGYRYRLHVTKLPGQPDLVFTGRRKVIFVHGCFWHRHEGCPLTRLPKSRVEFWRAKLEGNRVRDLDNQSRLSAEGWSFLVIWECEIKDRVALTARVQAFLGGVRC